MGIGAENLTVRPHEVIGSEPGFTLGTYFLLRRLGGGGMGTVWLAWDETSGTHYALKELRPPPGTKDRRRGRAAREAEAARRVWHPGVVSILAVFTDRDRDPWIVMTYVAGQTLEQRITDGPPLIEREIAALGLNLLEALGAAHAVDVLHRDVKPANIVLSDDRVVLVDFGIAQIGDGSSLTTGTRRMGTVEYMSPERIKEERLDRPSDLWSLGVTLFYALEGISPFRRPYFSSASTANAALTCAAVLHDPPPPIRRRGALADAIGELLVKDPRQRMDREQLAAALTEIVRPSPPKTPPSPELAGFPVETVIRQVATMDSATAAGQLEQLDPSTVWGVLDRLQLDLAAGVLARLPRKVAGAALVAGPSAVGARLLSCQEVLPSVAAEILHAVLYVCAPDKVGSLLYNMDVEKLARTITTMDRGLAVEMLMTAEKRAVAEIIGALDTVVAERLTEVMSLEYAASILRLLPDEKAADLVIGSSGRTELLLARLDERIRALVRRRR